MIRFPLSIRGVGGFLVVVGLVSCVLRLIGFNLRILLWVDLWGPAMGWLIRLGVVAIGAAMVVLPMILARKGQVAAGAQPRPAPGFPPPARAYPPPGAPGFAGQPGYQRPAPAYPSPAGAPGYAGQPGYPPQYAPPGGAPGFPGQRGYPPPPATPPSSPPDGPPPVLAGQPGYPPPRASSGYPPPDDAPTLKQPPRTPSYSQPAPAAPPPPRAPAPPPPAAAAPRPPTRSAQPQVPKTPLGAARPAAAKRTVFGHAGMAPGAAPRTPLTTVEDDDPFAGGDEGATEMSEPPVHMNDPTLRPPGGARR